MSIFSKIGKFAKKALPYAATAAGMYFGMPQVGSAIGGLFSGKSAAPAPEGSPDFMGPPDPNRVNIPGKRVEPDYMQYAAPIATGALNYLGQRQTNAANAQMAQKQMDFQASQTGTSYQRGTADMRAAGLNPMLAYSQGGASSGSGATATMGNAIGEGANAAYSAARSIQELRNLQVTNDQIKAQTSNIDADTLGKLETPSYITAQKGNVEQETRNKKMDESISNVKFDLLNTTFSDAVSSAKSAAKLADTEALRAKLGVNKDKAYSHFYGGIGKYYPEYSAALEGINAAGTAAGKLMPYKLYRGKR